MPLKLFKMMGGITEDQIETAIKKYREREI